MEDDDGVRLGRRYSYGESAMRVTVSGAAASAAYVEGENLHFIHLGGDEGWRSTAPSELKHVFLEASDVTEVEVADREEAEDYAERKADLIHVLGLLEHLMATNHRRVASLSASYLEDWLLDEAVRVDVEKYCFATRVPAHIDLDEVLPRVDGARSRALIQDIADAQPRIAIVDELLDRYLMNVADRPEERHRLKGALVSSGVFSALVRGRRNSKR